MRKLKDRKLHAQDHTASKCLSLEEWQLKHLALRSTLFPGHSCASEDVTLRVGAKWKHNQANKISKANTPGSPVPEGWLSTQNTNLARVWDTDMYQWGKLPAKEQCSNVKQKVVQAWGQLVTKSHQAVHAKLLSSPGCVSSSEWAEPRHSISNTFGFLDWVFSLSHTLYASILSRELKEFAPHSHFTSYPWVKSVISV